MSSRGRRAIRLPLLLLAIPSGVLAQSGAHFEPLSTPPRDVGTCTPGIGVDTARMESHRLVMKSTLPGQSRDMNAMVDRQGTTILYTEMSMSTSVGSTVASTGTQILASFMGDQMLFGSRTDTKTTYPDSILKDPHGFLNGRYQPSSTTARKPLDDSEQRRIRDLIAHLRQRCPA